MNILIRNISRNVTEAELRKLFTPFGTISSVNIVLDDDTGKSKGFGFVEMPELKEAKQAVYKLNGMALDGEKIRVKSTKRRN